MVTGKDFGFYFEMGNHWKGFKQKSNRKIRSREQKNGRCETNLGGYYSSQGGRRWLQSGKCSGGGEKWSGSRSIFLLKKIFFRFIFLSLFTYFEEEKESISGEGQRRRERIASSQNREIMT